jgi:hypothetical protein
MKPNHDARVSQIPAYRDEDSLRGTEPEIPENGGQNSSPDEKLPENRNAEKAVAKTGRAAKRPQIPASDAKNRPRGTQPEISENGGQNSPPDGKLQTPEGRRSGGPNSSPALALLNAYHPAIVPVSLLS